MREKITSFLTVLSMLFVFCCTDNSLSPIRKRRADSKVYTIRWLEQPQSKDDYRESEDSPILRINKMTLESFSKNHQTSRPTSEINLLPSDEKSIKEGRINSKKEYKKLTTGKKALTLLKESSTDDERTSENTFKTTSPEINGNNGVSENKKNVWINKEREMTENKWKFIGKNLEDEMARRNNVANKLQNNKKRVNGEDEKILENRNFNEEIDVDKNQATKINKEKKTLPTNKHSTIQNKKIPKENISENAKTFDTFSQMEFIHSTKSLHDQSSYPRNDLKIKIHPPDFTVNNDRLLRKVGMIDMQPFPFKRSSPLYAQSRSNTGQDSKLYVVKLPPLPSYYGDSKPYTGTANHLPVSFTSNGKPSKIYHWNLPVMRKPWRPVRRNDDFQLKAKRLNGPKIAFFKPKPNQVPIRNYFANNGRPSSIYLLNKWPKSRRP